VPKVQHKPIKSPRKGSNKKSKRQPKVALVWRIGPSGVPPDSVRCTREINSKLASFRNSESHSAIIHRTVRCAKRSNGYPRQRSSATATVKSADCARRVKAGVRWRTGQLIGPVRCTTGLSGGPHVRSSNGRNPTAGWRGWRNGLSGAPYDRSPHQRPFWWLGL
jgi:hypothetical protein